MPPSTPTPDTPTQQCAGSSSTSHHLNVDKPRTPPHTTSGTCLASCDNCNPVTTSNNQTAQGPHKESCGLAIADFISSSYTSSSSDESGPDCAPELGSTFNTYTAAGQRNYSSGACKTRSRTESADPSTYSGPQFIYDTGATSSFGSTRTPLDSTTACYRRIRGIGSNFCIARKEGPCKAIPNVAVSNCFGRNLASVSQLTRAHNNQLTFDKDRVYSGPRFPPNSIPPGFHVVGSATPSGLYNMDMDAYSHFVNHSSLGSTALSAGEAAMQMTSSFNASNQYPAQPTEPTYQPTSIHDIQLMSDQADKQQALLNSQFTNPNAYSVPLSLNARGDGPHPSARGQLSRRQYVPMTAGGTTSSGTQQAYPIHDYRPSENAMLLHTRMGHASKKVMIEALKQGINMGVPITIEELLHSNIYCKACATSHLTRKPFPRRSATEAHETILGLIHTDTAGPRRLSLAYQDRHQHLQGPFKYWQVYVDDHSKYIWVNFLAHKHELPSKMRRMRRVMELDARDSKQAPPPGQQPLKVQAYRSDNAGELTSKQAIRKLLKAMIDHERTVPGSSKQNAHAEAAIKVIQDMARTYLDSAKLSLKYWPFAIQCAAYTINRLPCTPNQDMKSRYEMFYGTKPDYKRLKTFGAVVTKFLPISKRRHGDKQSPSGEGHGRHRLVGYPRKTKGYLVLDTLKEPHPQVFACYHIHLQEDTEEFPSLSSDSYSDSTSETDSSSEDDSSSICSYDAYVTTSYSSSDESYEPAAYDSSTPTEAESSTEDSESLHSSSDQDSDNEGTVLSLSSTSQPATTDESQSESEPEESDEPDNSHRIVVKSKAKDTVNKLARRHGVNANLLCHVNYGIKRYNSNSRELQPRDHLKTGTELYLPTQSDEERFLQTSSSSDSSDESKSSDESPDPDAQESAQHSAPPENAQQVQESYGPRDINLVPRPPLYGPSAVNPVSQPPLLHEALTSLADPTAGIPLPESSYHSADMQADIDDEAFDLISAAYLACSPAIEATSTVDAMLHKMCTFVLPHIRNAISQGGQDPSATKALHEVQHTGFLMFQHAYSIEDAHLVEALRHIPARNIPTPKNHAEAMKSQYQEFWNDAVATEVANLKAYGVYKLEKLPPGTRPINCRYVFKVKANQQGLVDRLKARLVVQGFRQRYGIDYLKTHASVCKLTTFRYQMAYTAQHDLLHDIIDVKSAYLEAPMDMPVYINIPGQTPPPGMGFRLIKSLYGTKQAGHNWHQTIVPKLTSEWGFKQSAADPCMFYHYTNKSDYCILCLFVDDFSIVSTRHKTQSRDDFLKKISAIYNTSKSDDNNVYLGIRCRRPKPHTVFLDQELYITDFLHAYGFSAVRPAATPTSGSQLSKSQCPIEQSEKDAMSKHPYRHIIGSLRYLEQCTRPDIAFALNRLSRYQVNPGLPHWNELKHLVRYVAGTRHHGILFGKNSYPQHAALQYDLSGPLECFVDSDHAADKDTRRSTTGYVFYSRGGPISWRSRLQNSTAISTTEAEFMAASDAACENAWLRRLIGELTNISCTRINGLLIPKDIAAPKLSQRFYDNEAPIKFNEDNQACIRVSENPVLHGRMKHIDLKYHRLKEFVSNGDCFLHYVPTSHQIADIFTKPLTKQTFTKFRDCLVIPMDAK